MHIKPHIVETQSITNDSEYQCSNSKVITFKVDFSLDISTKLEQIRLNASFNRCNYNAWEPSNNLISSSEYSNILLINQSVLIQNYNKKYLSLKLTYLFIVD